MATGKEWILIIKQCPSPVPICPTIGNASTRFSDSNIILFLSFSIDSSSKILSGCLIKDINQQWHFYKHVNWFLMSIKAPKWAPLQIRKVQREAIHLKLHLHFDYYF